MMNIFFKLTKPITILVLLLIINIIMVQHANCSRVLKESFLNHKINDHQHVISKWLEENTKLFLQVLNTNSPTSDSGPNPSCNIPVCSRN